MEKGLGMKREKLTAGKIAAFVCPVGKSQAFLSVISRPYGSIWIAA
jgi:hypothetical protein